MARCLRELCELPVDDGLAFDADSIRVDTLASDKRYPVQRATLQGWLGTIPIAVQVDVGFNDAYPEGARLRPLAAMLPGLPVVRLKTYPREVMVAEKLHTMVDRGLLNSRLKDYLDLWTVAQRPPGFDADQLATAVLRVFARRGTAVPETSLVGLSGAFEAANRRRWTRLWRRLGMTEDTWPSLDEVIAVIVAFSGPVLRAIASGEEPRGRWAPGGPWEHE